MPRKRGGRGATPELDAIEVKTGGAEAVEPVKTAEKPKKDDTAEPVTKEDYQGWRGGLKIDLEKKDKNGKTLRERLSGHLKDTLEKEIANFDGRREKLRKWANQYDGKRDPKNFPHQYAANVAVPITRYCTDGLMVRNEDAIFNKKKIWILKPRPEYVQGDQNKIDAIRGMEDALDWFNRNVFHARRKLLSPFIEAHKLGTGVAKVCFERKTKTIYKYANFEEMADPTIEKYSLEGTKSKAVKEVVTEYEGPNIYPIAREDFIISSDATSIQDAYLVGFRTYQRRSEVNQKVLQKIYYADAASKITGPDKFDEGKENRAESKSTDLKKTEYEEPYEIWELCTKYDCDGDGDEDDITVSFHKDSGQILNAIYNPLFFGFRPFQAFRFFPREYSFDGYGVPEILEKSQEEVDTMHNQRIDRLSLINAPPILVRAGTELEKIKELVPGKIIPIDDELENNIHEFNFSDVYPSSANEEGMLVSYMRDVIGMTNVAMGVSTAERPVAKETLILQEETNKKFLFGTHMLRQDMTDLGKMLLEIFAQYKPELTYYVDTPEGRVAKSITFDADLIRNGLDVDLEASSEVMSQEVRREIRLTEYQLMGDYMTRTAGMVQALVNPQVPSDFKKGIVEALRIGNNLLMRIIQDFDEKDPENLVFNPLNVVDAEANIARSVDLMPQQPQPGQPGSEGPGQGGPQTGPEAQGGGPPGGPPQGMPPGMPPGPPPQGMVQ